MLEAAMLGIPYAGRIPDFAEQPLGGRAGGRTTPIDDSLQEQRLLREEQNSAYQQSLEVHRCCALLLPPAG